MHQLKYLALAAGVALAVSGLAQAASPVVSTHAGAGLAPDPAAPTAILFSQLDSPSGNGFTDQNFEPANDAFDSEMADDFTVTPNFNWIIDQVVINGSFSVAGPASSVNVTFYQNNAGLPGAAVCTYTNVVPVDPANPSFTVNLPTTCTLAAGGTFWMGFQVNQDFVPAGQHFWSTRTTVSGNMAAFRNPGNGFGTGCAAFDTLQNCLGFAEDTLFELRGTAVSAVPAASNQTLGLAGGLLALLGFVALRRRISG